MEKISSIEKTGPQIALLVWAEQSYKTITMKIIVLCEQTREANKRIIYIFLDYMFSFGNIVSDFHV